MPRNAQRYLEVDPWIVTERGFHPDRSQVSESVFSLSNEYMGVRGYFEEGYGGQTLLGSYFNGIFAEEDIQHPWPFKGFPLRSHFMVNTVDWLHTRIRLDGETLDLARSRMSGFRRSLDLREGVLRRELVWTTGKGKKLKLQFARFLSMIDAQVGCQRICVEPVNFTGSVELELGLDFSPPHVSRNHNFWACPKKGSEGDVIAILGAVERSGHRVFSSFRLASDVPARSMLVTGEKYAGRILRLRVRQGVEATVDKIVVNHVEKSPAVSDARVWADGMKAARRRAGLAFDSAVTKHAAYWKSLWETLDVSIEGDTENEQGLRFSIFQLHQTYHGYDPELNVGAKGLTGEAYNGHTFWDSETYCLPFYLFNNPAAARNLLRYRHTRLPQARERARQLDCKGARYPMCTIDGTEACGVWQHGDLEIHVPGAVSYGIWHYARLTNDKEFVFREGIEMLVEVSRFYASRGSWSQATGEFGFWCVMGPDEMHMMVHNNRYTNVIAKKTFEYTLEVLEEMRGTVPARLRELREKIGLERGEMKDWALMAAKMRAPRPGAGKVIEQHDGYFDMPHYSPKDIPPEEVPLYFHWAYYRMFQWDMIKQPDVLLLLLFFSGEWSDKDKKVNYEFYEPRCAHDSSLSPCVHSILASELGKHAEAYRLTRHAMRLDLDDYNRNTNLGLHTTSMAGAWMNLVYGYGGMRSDGEILHFKPAMPACWKSFGFRILWRQSVLSVRVDRKAVTMKVVSGGPVPLVLFGKRYRASEAGLSVPMPKDRIA